MGFRGLVGLLIVFAMGMNGRGNGQGVPVHFVNGFWFDGRGFVKVDAWVVDGVFRRYLAIGAVVRTVDLHGGYVVPPYGDAHEHNFDGVGGTAAVVQQYLKDGIFYAQGMTDTTVGANEVVRAGLVDTASTVDVTYAHGGLTGVNGHPKEVYESLALGGYGYPRDEKERTAVIGSKLRAGEAYWEIDSPGTLDAKWPSILAGKPDLIKVYLLGSEHFKHATAADPQLAKGIDPALVPLITAKAHAGGLKVAAHIDTAHDFHVAVAAGVDEMGHLPGYGMAASEDAGQFRLAQADVEEAGRRHVKVQATAGIGTDENTSAADRAARRASQIDNLRRLRAAGVVILVGSDRYGRDAVREADYLQGLGVWTNLEMLRMWAVETPQTIFPKRSIGVLSNGKEASFLVLAGDPLKEWAASHRIVSRWKQGQEIGESGLGR